MPMFGVMRLTFEREGGSMRGDDDFFSVARTIPLVAKQDQLYAVRKLNYPFGAVPLIPRAVTPWLTAFKAYSKSSESVIWSLRLDMW
jgi:hypothetical protein